MKNIEKVAQQFTDLEEVKRELKRLQSVKSRLKKQKAREDYEEKMQEVLKQEQVIKEVREYFMPKKVTVTTMTQEDIAKLNYDETVKAIKSIQSKKCNSQYLTSSIEDNAEYQEAVRIEEMLKEHRAKIKPVSENAISKKDLNDIVHHLENSQEDISKEYLLEQLKELMNK